MAQSHIGKVSLNIFYSMKKYERGQLYAGIGAEGFIVNQKDKHRRTTGHAVATSISIGRDFNLSEGKKVFAEISCMPVVCAHKSFATFFATSFKLGLGF